MASTIILSDNGVSSGTSGYKITAGNDGVLILQTTTSGGTATNAVYVDTSQNVGVGGVTPSSSSANWRGVNIYNATYQGRLSDGSAIVASNLDIGGNNYLVTGAASYYYQVGGAHKLYSAPSGTAGTGATATVVAQVNKDQTFALQGASSVAGTGISFPATQSASTDANTLDDYEEGSWTPVLNRVGTAPSVTYTRQVGTYVKIGKFVYVNCEIYISSVASQGTSYNCVTGFPFPVSNTNASWYDIGGSVKYNTIFVTTVVDRLSGGGGQGANGVSFLPANTSGTSEVNTNYQGGYLTFTAVYQTTA